MSNMFGIDLSALKQEIKHFQQAQAKTNALLEENNHLLTQILIQLGGTLLEEKTDSLKLSTLEEN